ncbi:hypothetical protein [Rhizobium laguerreae]|uniref:hypothetical protein n=1 Tax=Rhizobium laguerreae TaxID=1076926 RepID=UPI001A8F07B4|nr:hypothetical protein [Rhizobium laguerreae]MBN9987126.1 hypothetical protein [Rhizobium laguerreae]
MTTEFSEIDEENQRKLQQIFQDEKKAVKLETLVGGLVSELLNLDILRARASFQHGGDLGPAGANNRRFRIECKKYADTTSLKNREILGEISQALFRDPALEAWVLVSTNEVHEQLQQELLLESDLIGVPILFFDWPKEGPSSLAALCTLNPHLVAKHFSEDAGSIANSLREVLATRLSRVKRSLQTWHIGLSSLQERSHQAVREIWQSSRRSVAVLGQDVAGGTKDQKVRRDKAHEQMDDWWRGPALQDSPLCVIGWDGVGKTWTTVNWLVECLEQQPIVLVIASSAAAALTSISETSIKRFLADRLFELTGQRNLEHWLQRLQRLFDRPVEEGPALTVFFDGLNQEPSVQWLALMKMLQIRAFEGKVRVIASTRIHHFISDLSNLKGLVVPPSVVEIGTYGPDEGGELDRMLKFEKVRRSELHPDLIDLAVNPRLFSLVVRFREKFVEAGQITVHRLLWEYGRDSFGTRAGRSFSEQEWLEWLGEVARTFRDGARKHSLKSLGETASRPDLTTNQVHARLSDIVDGRFAVPSPGGFEFSPAIVAHALGAALLNGLLRQTGSSYDALNATVTAFLDPITGLDQRSEILRAAVSILVEQGEAKSSKSTGVLVTNWLHTQNITDRHRQELGSLANELLFGLLDAVERSQTRTHASARIWAVNALRAIPRDDLEAATAISERLRTWFCVVSRGLEKVPEGEDEAEKRRSLRLLERVGRDEDGPVQILSLPVQFIGREELSPAATAATILEGFPLSGAVGVFEAAALRLTLGGHDAAWDAVRWLCVFNEVDAELAAEKLRQLSEEVLNRYPESGVNALLPARVAALLLWLTGFERDDERANAIDSKIDHRLSYERDYLPNPSRSMLALERRHAANVLVDKQLPFHVRLQRARAFWSDPGFVPPRSFIDEAVAQAEAFDVTKFDGQMGSTIEEQNFKDVSPVLARFAPAVLTRLHRRRYQSLASVAPEARYLAAANALEHFILSDETSGNAASRLRASAIDEDGEYEALAAMNLLILETQAYSAREQFQALIDADLMWLYTDLEDFLKHPSVADIDWLIERYGHGSDKQARDLLILLLFVANSLSAAAWDYVLGICDDDGDETKRGVAFKLLATLDGKRFGKHLSEKHWSWSPAEPHLWINHFGSGALLEASLATPFEQIATRIVPWRLLEAANRMGGRDEDLRLVADIVTDTLVRGTLGELDAGVQLFLERREATIDPSRLSMKPYQFDDSDLGGSLGQALTPDIRHKRRKEAFEAATSRIRSYRQDGADFYLMDVAAGDFQKLLQQTPEVVDVWLEGMVSGTTHFVRRVRLAEGFYVALCEALLSHAPEKGVLLWHALRPAVTTRLRGKAFIDEFIHIPFRAPDSAAVQELREYLVGLEVSRSDADLGNVALGALLNGRGSWLQAQIDLGQDSPYGWKRQRAIVLSGFQTGDMLPAEDDWDYGEPASGYAAARRKARRLKFQDAIARYWWNHFLSSMEPEEAFASWTLFVGSADRRALVWMKDDRLDANENGEFFKKKMMHVAFNMQMLIASMRKREGQTESQFLDRRTVPGIGPWGKQQL